MNAQQDVTATVPTRNNVSDIARDFTQLERVRAVLPAGEEAYWTLPRVRNAWRLPRDSEDKSRSDELLLLPMRAKWYQPNAYLTVVPQPIIMHRQVVNLLEDYALRLFRHYPVENSMARREYGVPMLIGRFDAIVDKGGNIQICELDDVCSLWPALSQLNPIAESYVHALEREMGLPIYTSELFQYADGPAVASPRVRQSFAKISMVDDTGIERLAYIPRTTSLELAIFEQNGMHWRESQKPTDRDVSYYEGRLRPFYAHNEDHWHGDIHEAWLLNGKRFKLDEVALSVRAYRDMPGFKEHMDQYGPRSIAMAWERDSKWPLVPERLAVLTSNLTTATQFGRQWQTEHPGELLVFKTLYSARTGHTAIFSNRGTKLKGVSSITQIERKFGSASNDPIIVQPYKEPDSLATAGIRFIGTVSDNEDTRSYTDRKIMRGVEHVGNQLPGERVIAGLEDHFAMIFRSFVVYLPCEKRLVHIGGMWQATDGRIVHGGSHSVAGPLYADGLMGHPAVERTLSLAHAEELVLTHGHVPSL